MKKYLLKTVSICLGITLLCGMSSFRTPEGEKSRQSYRTAAISNDTIITSDGEGARCKNEIGENDWDSGECKLFVECTAGQWWLKLKNYCDKTVKARVQYKISYNNSVDPIIKTETFIVGKYQENPRVDHGYLDQSVCEPIRLKVCFVEQNSNNQNQQNQ